MTIFEFNTEKQIKETTTLQRVATGDPLAVKDCIDGYSGLVWSLAKKFTRNTPDAEDAVQEIFIDLWRHAGRFDPSKASEVTFISLIARRRLIDRLRKTTRLPHFQEIDDFTAVCEKSSEKRMHASLDARRATKIIDRFRPEQKRIMHMAIYAGMTHSEIAELTGMPLGTVKTNIRRGFQKVRRSLRIRDCESVGMALVG